MESAFSPRKQDTVIPSDSYSLVQMQKRNFQKKVEKLPTFRITGSKISLYSFEEMKKLKVVRVMSPSNRRPNERNQNVIDERFGPTDDSTPCAHCRQINCPGHYGLLELDGLILNPLYVKNIKEVLSVVCNSCGELLFTEEDLREDGLYHLKGTKRLEELYRRYKTSVCRRNVAINGNVTECTKNLEYLDRSPETNFQSVDKGTLYWRDDPKSKPKAASTKKIYEILDSISPENAKLLGFIDGHPRNMIMRGILIPPLCVRPNTPSKGREMTDPITERFDEIVKKAKGKKTSGAAAMLEVYTNYKAYLTSEKSSQGGSKGNPVSLRNTLQSKKGLVRGNLESKRCNKTARSVIGPWEDEFGKIRVPSSWKRKITKGIKVNVRNYKRIIEMANEGRVIRVINGKTGERKYFFSKGIEINVGDTVETELQNDYIPFNRQPTLSKYSFMAGKMVFDDRKTIGLNLSYTPALNADFDGDENNLWFTTNIASQVEAKHILNVENNIISSVDSSNVMPLIMNSPLAWCILSDLKKIKTDLFNEMVALIDREIDMEMYKNKFKVFGIGERSGYALFSLLLPDDFTYKSGNVKINKGILRAGVLNKKTLGSGKQTIIKYLCSKYGNERTSLFLTEAQKIANYFLVNYGFTVSYKDTLDLEVDENGVLHNKIDRIVKPALARLKEEVAEIERSSLDDIFKESLIISKLNTLLEVYKLILPKNGKENSILFMTSEYAGSKGNIVNFGQITGVIGQQFFLGQRVQKELGNGERYLPCFRKDDISLVSRGFVENSFASGCTPAEFFTIMYTAREGLIDTGVNVSATGDLSRQMNRNFEDVTVEIGGIFNRVKKLICPDYNGGYSIESNEFGNVYYIMNILNTIELLNNSRGWYKEPVQVGENLKINVIEPTKPLKEPKITRFEKCRLISERAIQLSNGHKPLIEGDDDIDSAEKEYDAGLIKIKVARIKQNGSVTYVTPTKEYI